jgi:flagellar protein FlaI
MVSNKFLKPRIGADKESEKAEGRTTEKAAAKKQMQKALGEVKRIAKVEKLQEKVVAKKRANTEKAKAKGNAESISKAQVEEAEALTVLEKIRETKSGAEAELRAALAALRGESAEAPLVESAVADTASSAVREAEAASPLELALASTKAKPLQELEKGVDYLELYPVNEPYAYVVITATSPPQYTIREASLTKGETELLKEVKTYLYETLDVGFSGLQKPEELLRKKVDEVINEFALEKSMTPERRDKIMYYINRDFIGYGKLDPLIRDTFAEDLSADGPNIPLYIFHRNYGSIETNVVFDKEELDALIYRLSQRSGRHISMAKPLLDASLPTKDRLQLSIGNEVTTRGSTFTIRKFREIPFTPINLVEYGTFSMEIMAYLWMAVEQGANILISGGTASGKTTVLNAIAMFIPPESKIISIEDTREINLLHQNWIPSVTREVEEGGYSIEMYDLLRTALRQRPEYVLVGEVRGVEAHTLFQAMATGHITMSTIHAESADTVVKRLTKHPIDVPLMLLDSLDIIAIQRQVKLGDKAVRKCTKIIEVTGINFVDETLETNELFTWRPDEFEFTGESKVFVKIMDKLNMNEEGLVAEFARRRRVLEGMRAKGMVDFQSLNKVLLDYSVNPEETEKRIITEE